jgi:hypothetical protein
VNGGSIKTARLEINVQSNLNTGTIFSMFKEKVQNSIILSKLEILRLGFQKSLGVATTFQSIFL